VRRTRGGAQSHLMRCSDGSYYVVKSQNNPQGLRVLANELLGTRFAARLGLRVPKPEIIEVREELIANTEDLVIQLGRGRQAIFYRDAADAAHGIANEPGRYSPEMIDNGFCFNSGEWNFPDAPLRGLYARHRVYESVRGIEYFGAWLEHVERITESTLEEIYGEIPPEWYEHDADAIEKMLEQLLRRRKLVRGLIVSAWKSSAPPFPNWR
jgi:hypothetical protein